MRARRTCRGFVPFAPVAPVPVDTRPPARLPSAGWVGAGGGWSLLLDTGAMGHDAASASRLLLEHGKVAATPMHGWGERNGDQFIRFVFSNEPVARLAELRDRVARALKQ